MYSWDCVRKALGHDHSRIVYLEEQLASLVDQSEDLKNEINSLKMIAEDVRPVMSPDKAFELLLNEVSLLFRRIATEDTEVIKAECPLPETLNWISNNLSSGIKEASNSPQMDENIQIVQTASLVMAEKKARELLQNQIQELKSDAAKQMENLERDIYKPSLSNLRNLKTWLQSKTAKTSPNRRVVSPKVTSSRVQKALPQLRVPSAKHRSELINPGGDGSLFKTVKSNLIPNKF